MLHAMELENTAYSLKQAGCMLIYRNLHIGILRGVDGHGKDALCMEVSKGMF